MRSIQTISVVVALFLASVLMAQPSCAEDNPLIKLGRGVANCLTFPLELPTQVMRSCESDGPIAAYTVGVVKGIAMTGLRAVAGVYEVATFPLPVPNYYQPILTNPEYMLGNDELLPRYMSE